MRENNAVSIALNKKKLWLWSIGCVLFIVLGFFFIFDPGDFKSPFIHQVLIIRLLGFIALIVFGYFLGTYIPELADKSPGLVIDEEGIVDNSTEVSLGKIIWEDIKNIYSKKVATNKFILIEVINK